MKNLLKWIIIITTAIIFIYAFSASYSSQNIDHLDYVIAISVDSIPDSDLLEVSFEFADTSLFSESSSSSQSEPIIDTVSAPSIASAVNIMNAYAGKQINLSHCKVVVFSEELAKKGILPEITFLMNDTQVRPTTNIVISTDSAKKYIENSISSLEQVLTKYYDIFPTSSQYTGYTSNVLLGDFYANLIDENSGAIAILGVESQQSSQSQEKEQGSSSEQSNTSSSGGMETSSSSKESNTNSSSNENSSQPQASIDSIAPGESIVEGDRGTENIGLCVFKDANYVGNLSPIETLCYSLIENEVYNFLVSIDNPYEPGKKIDLSVSRLSTSSYSIDTSSENPIINIKLSLSAKTFNGQETLDYTNTETLTKLNDGLKNYMSSKVESYLNKTSTEYKCDINGFYRSARKNFKTLSDFKGYNWSQKYPNAKFNIDIDSTIISSFLIQNS